MPRRTRPPRRGRTAQEEATIVRILNLLRVGISAGVGAMLDEIIAGEPNLPRRDAVQ